MKIDNRPAFPVYLKKEATIHREMEVVSMGQYRSVGKEQALSTSGLTYCSAIAVFSDQEKLLMHITGSNLEMSMSDESAYCSKDTRGGDVLMELNSKISVIPDKTIAIIFGGENGRFGLGGVLAKEYRGDSALLEFIRN